MHHSEHAREVALLEEALTVLFCLVDDIYQNVNPNGRRYESLKKLTDSEVITLALFQQLRGVESQRSFLRDASRFFSHLFPGVVGLAPSSLHRGIRKLRCFLEPLRRAVLSELVGEPETLLIDSTLLAVLHPRQVGQSAGFVGAAWVGEVGLLLRLWGEAPPLVRHQPSTYLLRAHLRQHCGSLPGRGTAERGATRGRFRP
jgi:hypothetical protein